MNSRWLLGCCLFSLSFLVVAADSIYVDSVVLNNGQVSVTGWVKGSEAKGLLDVRLLTPSKRGVSAQYQLQPARGDAVCYLLMVDTSLSLKKYFKQDIPALLNQLIKQKPDHQVLSLAAFDTKIYPIHPFSQDKKALLNAVKKIQAQGENTELFRLVTEGLSLFEDCPAHYRQVMLVVSDSGSEDQAYDVKDVIQAANQQQVSLYGVSFGQFSVWSSMMRFCADTGGLSQPFDDKMNVWIDAFYQMSDLGFSVTFTHPAQGLKTLDLVVQLANGKDVSRSINLPNLPPKVIQPVPTVKIEPWWQQPWVWAITVLFLLLGLRQLMAKPSKKAMDAITPEPIGWLLHQGESCPLFSGINRLGALSDSDVVIDDDTVSRNHATIHQTPDGDLCLTDLDSTNGCFVNQVPIQLPTVLCAGDEVVLGEWQAIFQLKQQGM